MSRLLHLTGILALAAGFAGCSAGQGAPSSGRDSAGADDRTLEGSRSGEPEDGFTSSPDCQPVEQPTGDFGPLPDRLGPLLIADFTPPPISGGTLAIASDGTKVVAADPDRDSIYVIDPASGSFRTIELVRGSEPGRVVVDDERRAHVALRNLGAIISIDLDTSKILLHTTVCPHPRGMAFDRKNAAILVACASGELVELSADAHGELSRVFVDRDLRDVVVANTGVRFVSRYRSAELLQVSHDGQVLTRRAPHAVQALSFATPPTHVDWCGDPRVLKMSPTLAWRTISGADGLPLLLHQQSQDDEVAIERGGGYGFGRGCSSIVRPAVTKYDETGTPGTPWAMDAPGSVVDVAQSPDGEWMAFAHPGAYLSGKSGSVSLMRLQDTSLASNVRADDAGVDASQPCPATNVEFGQEVQATAVAFDAVGQLYVFSREPAQLTVFPRALGQAPVAPDKPSLVVSLSAVSVRDTGHDLFHADVGMGLACVSCHGEALDDGHVWSFESFGLRRTQNIRGALHSALHWEGKLLTFKNLLDELMTRRMSGIAVAPQYADALASWIDKTPAFELEPSTE